MVIIIVGVVGWASTISVVAIAIWALTHPVEAGIWWNRLLSLRYFLGPRWHQRSIKRELEARIDSFGVRLNKDAPGVVPFGMKIKFVGKDEAPQLLSDSSGKKTVLVRIRDRRRDERNTVHALLAFAPLGVAPKARRFMTSELSRAIDYTVTREVLIEERMDEADDYLIRHIMEEDLGNSPEMAARCSELGHIQQAGMLAVIYLKELVGFAQRRIPVPGDTMQKQELVDFGTFLSEFTQRPQRQSGQLDFNGADIAVGLIPIGVREKIQSRGAEPYLEAIRFKANRDLPRAYLMSYGPNALQIVLEVANQAERLGLGKLGRMKRWQARTGPTRDPTDHVILEFVIPVPPDRQPIRTSTRPKG